MMPPVEFPPDPIAFSQCENPATGSNQPRKKLNVNRFACLACALFALIVLACAGIHTAEPDREPKQEPATCKELVDRLKARGMDVVLMDATGPDLIPAVWVRYARQGEVDWKRGGGKITQFPTEQRAKEMAGATRNGFAFGRFLIEGDPELVEEIKKHL
jgi:hypothetical protein